MAMATTRLNITLAEFWELLPYEFTGMMEFIVKQEKYTAAMYGFCTAAYMNGRNPLDTLIEDRKHSTMLSGEAAAFFL